MGMNLHQLQDVVICIDVLVHEVRPLSLHLLRERLLARARHALLLLQLQSADCGCGADRHIPNLSCKSTPINILRLWIHNQGKLLKQGRCTYTKDQDVRPTTACTHPPNPKLTRLVSAGTSPADSCTCRQTSAPAGSPPHDCAQLHKHMPAPLSQQRQQQHYQKIQSSQVTREQNKLPLTILAGIFAYTTRVVR